MTASRLVFWQKRGVNIQNPWFLSIPIIKYSYVLLYLMIQQKVRRPFIKHTLGICLIVSYS